MKIYHVTVDAPPVWIEVRANNDDEAADKAMALADRALLGVWFDGHAPGDDDATIGFCDGRANHGPFDFGAYDLAMIGDDDGEPEYEDFGPLSPAELGALAERRGTHRGGSDAPDTAITAAIPVADAEVELRTAAIYRTCKVAREEALPIDDMLAGGVPEEMVTEWDRWCIAAQRLRETQEGWERGDLITADADAPDLTGWAWRVVREWPNGETVATRYTDDPQDEWPVRWRNERDGRWYTMRRI